MPAAERFRWAAVAALVLVSAYGSWWARRAAMAPAPVRSATFTLRAPATDVSRHLALPIPAGIPTVLLRLEGERADGAVRVELRTAGGRMVWSGAGQVESGGVLAAVRVPAASLPPGDYVATATRATTAGQKVVRYPFRTTTP